MSTTGSVTPQPPGRMPHRSALRPRRRDPASPEGGPRTPGPPEGSEAPAREAIKRAPLVATALVLAILAALFAAWSGWSWYRASTAGPPPDAQLRDQVLQAGEQAVQNFNTLDYRKVAAGLALWEQSSTGPLHTEISKGRTQFERQIQQTKTITTARVLDGALTALNPRAGTASIIVAVQITVTPANGAPVTKQSRLIGTLAKTASGWKLSQLGQVPVGAAASGSAKGSSGG